MGLSSKVWKSINDCMRLAKRLIIFLNSMTMIRPRNYCSMRKANRIAGEDNVNEALIFKALKGGLLPETLKPIETPPLPRMI